MSDWITQSFAYIPDSYKLLDILATVPFWGAADICFVGNRKIRQRAANFVRRFNAIRFAGKQQPGTETR